MELDVAVQRLTRAVVALGGAPPRPPEDLAALHALEAEIAPYRLPADLRRWWETVDPWALPFECYPAWQKPEWALDRWRWQRDELPDQVPRLLVHVGYESHQVMYVELEGPGTPGGALFESFLQDGDFTLRFHTFADWVLHVAGLLEAGDVGWDFRPWFVPDPDGSRADLRPPVAPHPLHAAHVGGDVLDWPPHWRHSIGLDDEALVLRGATHTVAEVLAAVGALRATIHARVDSLFGGGGTTRLQVSDDSGTIDLDVPSSVGLVGPAIDQWYEFDLVLGPDAPPAPYDPVSELARVEEVAYRFPAEWLSAVGRGAQAAVVGVRRV